MKKLIAAVAVALTFLFAACRLSQTATRVVKVPGNAPAAEKARIAEQVGAELYQSILKPELKRAFPELTDEQLKGLFVRMNETRWVTGPKAGREPRSKPFNAELRGRAPRFSHVPSIPNEVTRIPPRNPLQVILVVILRGPER